MSSAGNRVRILVAEDEDALRNNLSRQLEKLGYEVRVASDGAQALRELSSGEPFDLVITDIFMPEVDGLQFIRSVRREHPSVKVIATSGGPREVPAEKGGIAQDMLRIAELIGAASILKKPFELDALRERVEMVLASKPSGRTGPEVC